MFRVFKKCLELNSSSVYILNFFHIFQKMFGIPKVSNVLKNVWIFKIVSHFPKNIFMEFRKLSTFKKIGISKLFAVFKNNQKCLRISTLQWVNKHFAVGNNQIQSSFPLASNGS